MGHKKLAGEDTILKHCPLWANAAIQNHFDEGLPCKEERVPCAFDLVSGISHGLKSASHFRMRLQEEIKDILARQSLNIHAGTPSAKWDESLEHEQ